MSGLVPGNAPNAHWVPLAHSALESAKEQHVSAHLPPVQSPERHWAFDVHVAPPMEPPSVAERASHAGFTQ